MLLASSARFFQKMYRVGNFIELSSALQNINANFFTDDHDRLNKFTQEHLIDDVKLVICLENYMKSVLLKESYLIHLIKPSKSHRQFVNLKSLQDKQKTTPISLVEFLSLDSIIYDSQRRMNIFPSLSSKTLAFGKILNQPDYKAVLKLPVPILKIATEASERRNNLHYLLGEGAAYSAQLIEDIKQTAQFVDKNIINPFNIWCEGEHKPKIKIKYCGI